MSNEKSKVVNYATSVLLCCGCYIMVGSSYYPLLDIGNGDTMSYLPKSQVFIAVSLTSLLSEILDFGIWAVYQNFFKKSRFLNYIL